MPEPTREERAEQISSFQLWKIEAHIREALIMREGDEEFDESHIDELNLAFDEKVDKCAAASENLKEEIRILTEKKAELDKRIKALKKNNDGLKNYIKSCMEGAGKTHAGTGHLRVRIQRSPLSVEVLDMDDLAEEFIKVIKEPRKQLLVKHIKETGEIPDGVEPIHSTHLRVY